MQAWCPNYYCAAWRTLLCIHRIGRVFTKEAISQLQSEAVASGESTGTASTARQQNKTAKDAGCGGLLWQMAWCPLLQVSRVNLDS